MRGEFATRAEGECCNKVTSRPQRLRTQYKSSTITTSSPRAATISRGHSRRRYRPTTQAILKHENQGIATILNDYASTETIRKQYFRTTGTTKIPKVHITTANVNRFTSTVSLDQASDSSNQQLSNKNTLVEKPLTLKEVTEAISRSRNSGNSNIKQVSQEVATTAKTMIVVTTPRIMNPQATTIKSRKRTNATSQLVKTIKPLKYDYYENFSGILKSIPEHSKVLIDDGGVIHCLDQGNFPHPVSCKKFISCARMEGKVLGWEYTCPKGLSFDPIGGMCNWSADLGCDE